MAVRLNNRIHAAEGDFRRILVVLRLPKGQNGGKQKMKKEDREMIEKIMATEKVGYAYVYPMDGDIETCSSLIEELSEWSRHVEEQQMMGM